MPNKWKFEIEKRKGKRKTLDYRQIPVLFLVSLVLSPELDFLEDNNTIVSAETKGIAHSNLDLFLKSFIFHNM